jgi:hypothetical protein
MEKLLLILVGAIALIATIAGIAVIGGTLVWVVWPTAVTAFPTLVANGYLVSEITWPAAVCLTYICGVLFKSVSGVSTD